MRGESNSVTLKKFIQNKSLGKNSISKYFSSLSSIHSNSFPARAPNLPKNPSRKFLLSRHPNSIAVPSLSFPRSAQRAACRRPARVLVQPRGRRRESRRDSLFLSLPFLFFFPFLFSLLLSLSFLPLLTVALSRALLSSPPSPHTRHACVHVRPRTPRGRAARRC